MSKTTKVNETMLRGIRWLFAAVITIGFAVQAVAIDENKSNLWFGSDEGIEVVWKTGENLAFNEQYVQRFFSYFDPLSREPIGSKSDSERFD